MEPQHSQNGFAQFAHATADVVGRPSTFMLAASIVVAWALTGPVFAYSDTWQLVINTGTTIVTFLMVFVIQNTQNRDARAMHLKLDELIRATKGARNTLVAAEDLDDDELLHYMEVYSRFAREARRRDLNGGKAAEEPGDAGKGE